MRTPLKVIFSIDVEEEGLFSGRYEQHPQSCTNISLLPRLEAITSAHGIPLTLLCDYPVLNNPETHDVLLGLQERGAALGLHLHHWNTPPYQDCSIIQPAPSKKLPLSLLSAKLDSLLQAFSVLGGTSPLSFRMGRWDFSTQLQEALIASPIQIDSSITPLRPVPSQKNHFLCGVSPYWISPRDNGTRSLLEFPLTLHPVSFAFARFIYRTACTLPDTLSRRLLRYFRLLFVVGVQPVWYPLLSMKWATMFHVKQQEPFLVMFMHSSELLPGANPVLPDQSSIDALLKKIDQYLFWLRYYTPIQGVTFSQAYQLLAGSDSDSSHRTPLTTSQ